MTWPRNDRCTCWISPRPLHMTQVSGVGARRGARAASQDSQRDRRVDGDVARALPNTASARLDLDPDQRVLAATRRGRGPR